MFISFHCLLWCYIFMIEFPEDLGMQYYCLPLISFLLGVLLLLFFVIYLLIIVVLLA